MDILLLLAKETFRFCIGFCGFYVLTTVFEDVCNVIEGLVKWIGNKMARRK